MTRECDPSVPFGGEPRGSLIGRLSSTGSAPLSALIGLTERCNLRCRHCFSIARAGGELQTHEWRAVLDDLASAGVLMVTFTGGEVGLRPDLEALVEHAVDRRFAVYAKTNGTLLDAERAERLHAAGLLQLQISLYDLEPEAHDEFVGHRGAWKRSVAAAEAFAAAGGRVRIANVAMAWNWRRIPALLDWCESRGFGYLVDPDVACRNDGDQGASCLRLGEDDLVSLLSDPRLVDIASFHDVEPGRRSPDSPLCMAGVNGPYIGPRGDVQLCQRLPMVLGNVRDAPFSALWRSSSERQRFLALRWRDVEGCSECELDRLCSRCPATALLESGSLLVPSAVDCRKARAMKRLLEGPRR